MAMKTRKSVKYTKEENDLDICLYMIRDIFLSRIFEDENAENIPEWDGLDIYQEAYGHLHAIRAKRRRRECRAIQRNAARKKPLNK